MAHAQTFPAGSCCFPPRCGCGAAATAAADGRQHRAQPWLAAPFLHTCRHAKQVVSDRDVRFSFSRHCRSGWDPLLKRCGAQQSSRVGMVDRLLLPRLPMPKARGCAQTEVALDAQQRVTAVATG